MRFQDLLRKSVFPTRGREGTDDSFCGDAVGKDMDRMDIESPGSSGSSMQERNLPIELSDNARLDINVSKASEIMQSTGLQRRKTPPISGAPQPGGMPPNGRQSGLSSEARVSAYIPAQMQRDVWSINDFIVRKRLYEGYSSVVSQAVDRVSGMVVALKVYNKAKLSELNRAQVEREIRIHIELQHMYIIQLYAAWEDETAYYLVQEFATEGDVFTEVHRRGGQLSEKAAVNLVLQPFLASLHYLHMKNIIHRDIKPENLLFTHPKTMKVADFGLAIDHTMERPVTRAGTLDYMAPEVIVCPSKRRPNENKERMDLAYTEKVDAWSVGVLAYELIVGFPPFERESRQATLEGIIYSKPHFPQWMSEDSRDFIQAALCKDFASRPSIPDMLRHPWIQIHERRRSHRTIPVLDFLPRSPSGNLMLHMGFDGADSVARQEPLTGQQHRQTTSFGPQSLFQLSMPQMPFSNPPDHVINSPQAPGSPLAAPGSPRIVPGSPFAAPGSPFATPGSPFAAPGSPGVSSPLSMLHQASRMLQQHKCDSQLSPKDPLVTSSSTDSSQMMMMHFPSPSAPDCNDAAMGDSALYNDLSAGDSISWSANHH